MRSDAIVILCLTIKTLIKKVDSLEELLQSQLEEKFSEIEPKLTTAVKQVDENMTSVDKIKQDVFSKWSKM